MDETTRREPAFEAESDAYSLFQRGLAFLREQHGRLRRMPFAQKGEAALEQRVGLALGLEGRLAPGRHVHAASLRGRAAVRCPASPRDRSP